MAPLVRVEGVIEIYAKAYFARKGRQIHSGASFCRILMAQRAALSWGPLSFEDVRNSFCKTKHVYLFLADGDTGYRSYRFYQRLSFRHASSEHCYVGNCCPKSTPMSLKIQKASSRPCEVWLGLIFGSVRLGTKLGSNYIFWLISFTWSVMWLLDRLIHI